MKGEVMFKDVAGIDEAKEEGDESTKKFLKGILKDLTEYTEISKNLIDIYAPCGDDLFKMILMQKLY